MSGPVLCTVPVLLDRTLQRRILERLAGGYPNRLAAQAFKGWTPETLAIAANLAYLEEHGLVSSDMRALMDGRAHFTHAKITAAGLDFLADDGGLSAILGVVTVKLHDDTIRQLLLAKVDASDAPSSVKDRLREAIKNLPAEGLKATTMDLLKAGLDQLPDAIPRLVQLLGL